MKYVITIAMTLAGMLFGAMAATAHADIDGEGHTDYVTVPATAKFVKLYYLTLTPMS
jgi:hypothetical protein